MGSLGWLATPDREQEFSVDGVTYRWRGQLTDAEMVGLVARARRAGCRGLVGSDTRLQSGLGYRAGD